LADILRFQRIDSTNIDAHPRLKPGDECYFLFEYTSGKDFNFSATNNLISNLKKKPSRSGLAEYRYKLGAMSQCSKWLNGAINPDWLRKATLVPVPPSKMPGDREYDDRMTTICRDIPAGFSVDVRELVVQQESLEAAHESASGERPTVGDLLRVYGINEEAVAPAPSAIGIVDDVLTAGTHYRAMHEILRQRFPGVPIVGFFIARRVFPDNDLDDPPDPVDPNGD
jgi:hypothetical protein